MWTPTMKAQHGAMVVADLHHWMSIRIWICIKVKNRNWIRIKVKRGIRTRIRVMRIPQPLWQPNNIVVPWSHVATATQRWNYKVGINMDKAAGKCSATVLVKTVFRIRIRTGSGFHQVSGSGSERAEMTHKK
jgi:hypothetical protein